VSWAEYTSGEIPDPSTDDLVEMSRHLGEEQNLGELVESSGSVCDFGKFGTAIFRSPDQRIQIWHLSNGRDFITVTHIAPPNPDPEEVREVQEIVRTLTFAAKKLKWKL
jgi:hypothetical protein